MSATHTPRAELFWRPDPNVDAARRLPRWAEFHRICGRSGLHFDHIQREGGRTGPYTCSAMTTLRTSAGGYAFKLLHTGKGRDVLSALRAAYVGSEVQVPSALEMLDAGLLRAEVAPAAPEISVSPISEDPFEELFS